MTDRMPALYIGHGAPPLLDDPHLVGPAAPRWAARPAAPEGDPDRQRALGVRAGDAQRRPARRWSTTSAASTPKYYRMTYETPDATALAQRVAAMMPATEPVHQHASRGLDHGAWVPLKIMYPDGRHPGAADVAAHPRPGTGCWRSASGCARCATRAC